MIDHILARREPYRELGADYFEQQTPEAKAKRLVRQREKLGYIVNATPAQVDA